MWAKLFRFFDVFTDGPFHWPRPWRRGFLLTLPISLPLFAAVWFVTMALAIVGAAIFGLFIGLFGSAIRRLWA